MYTLVANRKRQKEKERDSRITRLCGELETQNLKSTSRQITAKVSKLVIFKQIDNTSEIKALVTLSLLQRHHVTYF